MARPKRIDLPYSLYKVSAQTSGKEAGFRDAKDRKEFLDYLSRYADLFSFQIHAYCLLRDRFYLLAESTRRAALSEFMRRLLTSYTVYFNRRHKRHGHLFHGRFKSQLVDKNHFLSPISRDIHLAPVRSNKRAKVETYPGSSLQYYIKGGEPEFLTTGDVLADFRGNRRKYAGYVKEGLKKDTKIKVLHQKYIGKAGFARRMDNRIDLLEKPRTKQSRVLKKREQQVEETDRKRAEQLVRKVARYFKCRPDQVKRGRYSHGEIGRARSLLMVLFRENLPWTCREISDYFGLKAKSGMSYYQQRIRNDRKLSRAYREFQQ